MDEVELREFLRERYPRLVGAVALVKGDVASAEDAVQEAIVRAWERTERGEEIVALDRWVAAVAMNLSGAGCDASAWSDSPGPGCSPRRRSSRAAIGSTSRAHWPSFPGASARWPCSGYLLDLSTEEIAKQMRTSEGTVKSQLFKARGHLANALALVEEPHEENSHAEHR